MAMLPTDINTDMEEIPCPKCKKPLLFVKEEGSGEVKFIPPDSKTDLEAYIYTKEQLKNKEKYKLCPKCMTLIEKTEGCNRMQCARCRHIFCWVCQNDWGGGTETGGAGYTLHARCNQATGVTPHPVKVVRLPRPGTVIEVEEQSLFKTIKKWLWFLLK